MNIKRVDQEEYDSYLFQREGTGANPHKEHPKVACERTKVWKADHYNCQREMRRK